MSVKAPRDIFLFLGQKGQIGYEATFFSSEIDVDTWVGLGEPFSQPFSGCKSVVQLSFSGEGGVSLENRRATLLFLVEIHGGVCEVAAHGREVERYPAKVASLTGNEGESEAFFGKTSQDNVHFGSRNPCL